MKTTIWKLVLNEIWPAFFTGISVFVFLIVATRMLSITEMIVVRGVGLRQVLMILVYLLPDIVAFALPAAALMAVVISFTRLSADSELIALKASGVSLYQMLPPVIAFSAAGMIAALVVSFVAVPWGNRSFREMLFRIAQSKADMGIKERVFCQPFDGVVFYVKRFSSRERLMEDVFVVDSREPRAIHTILAKEGRLFVNAEKSAVTLHFLDGTIFVSASERESDRVIRFSTYDLHVNLKDAMESIASRERKPMEMSAPELMDQIRRHPSDSRERNRALVKLLEKVTLPIAVFLMGVIGVPLGAHMRGRGRPAGIGLSLIVFLAYYLFIAGVKNICETGAVSPWIGAWVPDAFLLLSSVYLLRRVAGERRVNPLRILSRGAG